MVNTDIAKQIIEKTKSILSGDILFCNPSGICLASSIPKFRDIFIPEAVESIYKKKVVKNNDLVWLPVFSKNKAEGSIGILAKEDLSKETVKLVQNLVEVMIFEITFINKLSSDLLSQEEFSKTLLTTDKFESKEDALSQADVLRINLRFDQVIMIFKIDNLKESFLSRKERLEREDITNFSEFISNIRINLRKIFNNSSANSFVYWEPNIFIVFMSIDKKENIQKRRNSLRKNASLIQNFLQDKTGNKVSVGIGQYYPELDGLKDSFAEARLALEVGIRIWGKGNIHHILDIGIFAVLDNTKGIEERVKKQIVYQILSPLLEKEFLFSVVKVFLDSEMDLTKASKKLHIHRNTLIYRLNKVKKLIGLDPRVFEDSLQIKLGLMFLF